MFKQLCFRLLLLASAIATSLSAAAYSFESAGIYYNITGDNTVEVTYSDRDNNTYSGSISVPETVTNNGTEYSVTTIGESAFKGSAVTSVSMPEGITIIGFEAFSGCQNLESVALPESLTTLGIRTFGGCQSLKTIKIPSGVRAIPSSCFNGCSSLESVTIPEGVTSIEGSAFWSCNLNALTLPESLETIGSYAFCNNCVLKSVNIPAKVKTIESDAFYNCGLTELVIPEEVQTIDNYAFCNNPLKKLTLPSTITSIGSGAFLNNYSLQSITCNATTPPSLGENAFNHNISTTVKVPLSSIAAYRQAEGWKNFTNYYNITGDNTVEVTYSDRDNNTYSGSISVPETVTNNGTEYSVTTIGESAFKGSAVTSVSMPEGITIIGFEAFSGCQNLESVALPESLTTLGIRTFGGCQSLKTIKIPSGVRAIPSSCFNGCSSLESVTIPEGVTSIEGSAFWSCNLNALTLPESLETIGSYAFCNNCVLKSVNIPAKVKTIESDAFYNCGLTELVIPEEVQTIDNYAFCNNPLKKLTLPSTITSIGSGAFLNNYSLQSITCNATTPPSLGENAFNHNISTTVKVPLSSIAAYRQAEGWKNFTNYYGGEVIADGITYRIDENDAMVAAAEATLTEANIPSSVEFEGNQYPVIKINDEVFSGNTNLTSVTLPESLTTLGDRAFYTCKSLKTIKIPSGVTAIPDYCFNHCLSLESVTIPEGVTTIGDGAFVGCNLKELTLPSTVTMIESGAFLSNNRCQSITCNATTPPNLGENVFGYNASTTVKVPLQSIAAYRQAEGWKNFTNYYGGEVIADGITYRIDENDAMVAAAEATLTEANIPSSVEFEGNQYPVIKINDEVFSGNTNLTSVTLPESLTTLGDRAFYTCKSLKTIKIPSGVTAIPDYCFNHCLSLESVTIPEGVTTIGDGAFVGCNLKELTLPSTVTMIESGAFLSNNRCQSITCNATTPPNLGENVFGYNASTTVKVPLQSIAAYRQAVGWKNFANYYGGEVVADGITYRINEKEAMVVVAEATLTEANILSAVEFEGNQYPVIKINDNVFADNTNLKAVTLPEGLVEIGAFAFNGCQNLGSVALPESLTTLGSYAFYSCKLLKTIKIPSGVTTIPYGCFLECSLLESVTIPEGVTTIGEFAFFCSNIKELILPSTVTEIGDNAFYRPKSIICNAATPPTLGDNAFDNDITPSIKVPLQSIAAYRQAVGWKNFANYYGGEVVADGITYRIDDNGAMVAAAEVTLTEANIPSVVEFEGNQYAVIKINDYVFSGNTNLKAVTLPEGLVEIGAFAFNGCQNLGSVVLPESLTTLGRDAFQSCKSLRAVKIPSGVTAIPDQCFYVCSSLESVIIPEGVMSIGSSAFASCNLKTLTLPESLTTLGSDAFRYNQMLEKIEIPSKVTEIPQSCFERCLSLESVTIPEGVTAIGDDAFQSCNLNALTLPESLEAIGSYAFFGNRSLKSVNIPAKVKTIESYAFASCGLTDLVIPEGVQAIGNYAFGWNSLQNLTLPSTITSIGESVFYDNYYLQLIICNAATPPTLGDNAFDNDITPSIKVPLQSIAAYRQAVGWKNFANYYGGEVVADGITYRIDDNGAMVAAAETSLTEANIPSAVEFEGNQYAVTKINDKAFSDNTNLTAVTLPESVVTLGSDAFSGCQSLKTIKIPSKVTAIPDRCFVSCSSLENVTIPEGVTTLGLYAFY